MNTHTEPDLYRRGLMYVLSSPSGAGKTTITRALMENNTDLIFSCSVTTRPRRPGEVQGRDYYFVDIPEFDAMVGRGDMLEYAKVFDHYYGTPRHPVEEALQRGQDVVFDIDWQGTQQLSEKMRADLVTVFILPPSHAELERRLRGRGQNTDTEIRARMEKAGDEMTHYSEYDYVLINQDIHHTIACAQAILEAERLRRHRILGLSDFVRGVIKGL